MYKSLSSQILKFNLRPDLYADPSWLQDLHQAQGTIRIKASHDFQAGEYLLKQYGLYGSYCWHFNTPMEKLALQDVVLMNRYIISLIYCKQICQTISGVHYRYWLDMLTDRVMNFALFQAPYLPTYQLTDVAVKINSAPEQQMQIMESGITVMKYLFASVASNVWLRVRMHFPRNLTIREHALVNIKKSRFAEWFMRKIVMQELGYAVY